MRMRDPDSWHADESQLLDEVRRSDSHWASPGPATRVITARVPNQILACFMVQSPPALQGRILLRVFRLSQRGDIGFHRRV